jgi:hypothetical protein
VLMARVDLGDGGGVQKEGFDRLLFTVAER